MCDIYNIVSEFYEYPPARGLVLNYLPYQQKQIGYYQTNAAC